MNMKIAVHPKQVFRISRRDPWAIRPPRGNNRFDICDPEESVMTLYTGESKEAALAEVFGDLDGMGAIFNVDRSGHTPRLAVFVFRRELDAIEARMAVHHLNPAINADHRLDATIASGKGVDLASERIQPVLVSSDDEAEKLFVRRFGHQRSFQRLQQTSRFNIEFARHYRERGLFLTWDQLLFHRSSLAFPRAFHSHGQFWPLPVKIYAPSPARSRAS